MNTFSRRGLIVGLGTLFATPSIVRAQSLMRVSGEVYRVWKYTCPLLPPIPFPGQDFSAALASYFGPNGHLYEGTWTYFGKTGNIYSDKCIAFSKREFQ